MKKHLLSVLGLIAAGTLSATQYMHVNLADGKEYDIKIEKTDRVSHINQEGEAYIKVTRTDNSYSLYPLKGAEVSFDEEIARMEGNVSDWSTAKSVTDGCVYDTSEVHALKEIGASESEIIKAKSKASNEYFNCQEMFKSALELSKDEVEVHRSANKYASELFDEITKTNEFKNKNVVFSPTSLQFALAMLTNGTDNDNIYSSLTKALGRENMPLDQLNVMYNKRMDKLMSVDTLKFKFSMANATFLQKDTVFGKNFLQNLEYYYNATMSNVDFQEDSTYALMNKWASDNTEGMIPKIGVQRSKDLICVLSNALCFKSEWANQFSASYTAPGKFVTSAGVENQVDKMKQGFSNSYAEGDNYQLVTLPFYEGFVMNVILPKEGITPEAALREIDVDNINYMHSPDTTYIASLSLPKFYIDNNISLNDVLRKMGLGRIFERNFNNFDKIAKSLYVSKANQNTHLEIDEDGAKGAAVTTISMNKITAAGPLYIKTIDVDVNRPFIVTVNNPYTHEILFIGLINDPNDKGGF